MKPGGGSNTNLIPKDTSADYRAALIKPEVMQAPVVWLSSGASDRFTTVRAVENDEAAAASYAPRAATC